MEDAIEEREMMTEAEAKTKWCPFSRVGQNMGDKPIAVNRTFHESNSGSHVVQMQTRCLASGCMAWGWLEPEYHHRRFIPDPSGELDENGDRKGTWEEHPEKRRGYCGLAGSL